MSELNWPDKWIDRDKAPRTLKKNLWEWGKIALAFADEAIVLIVMAYILYRFVL